MGQLQLTITLRKCYKPYLFFIRYVKINGLAIIQDFAAHCAMKNEEMAQVRKFYSKSKLEGKNPL